MTMSAGTNSLVKIPRSNWVQLRDLYANEKIASCSFNLLQCVINWVQQNSELDIDIFSLSGDWESDGTFVIKGISNYHIYCNTLSQNLNRLITALNCLDNNAEYLIYGFPHRILPAIEQVGHHRVDSKIDTTVWYHFPRVEAAKFEIVAPSGVTLARLQLSHADYINSAWPHRSPGSVKFVERLITYNESIGAFDENGELMAYCLQLPIGSMGLLQVKEQHRRKALAQLVVRYMAKTLASKNFEVLAPVVITNAASRSLFEKLGFSAVDQVYWAMWPGVNDANKEIVNLEIEK